MQKSLVLKTGMFPETNLLESALYFDGAKPEILVIDPDSMSEADWDTVVEKILLADKIITL